MTKTQTRKFHKTTQGQYIALFQFSAQQENDISVERGEFVTVLNKDDNDWYWIKRSDNQEGFVPSNYVRQADAIPIRKSARSLVHNTPYRSFATLSDDMVFCQSALLICCKNKYNVQSFLFIQELD